MVDPRARSKGISQLKADFPDLEELKNRAQQILKSIKENKENFDEVINFYSTLIKVEIALLDPEINNLHGKELEELNIQRYIKNSSDLAQALYMKYKTSSQKKDTNIASSINILTIFILVLTFLLIKLEVANVEEGVREITFLNRIIRLDSQYIDILFIFVFIYFFKNETKSTFNFLRKSISSVFKNIYYFIKDKLTAISHKHQNITVFIVMIITFLIIFIFPMYFFTRIFM
jgi:hypothetical protein